eukprot:COSAG05_NODE_1116_length_5825_cov_11.050304_2_plen_174_part_00
MRKAAERETEHLRAELAAERAKVAELRRREQSLTSAGKAAVSELQGQVLEHKSASAKLQQLLHAREQKQQQQHQQQQQQQETDAEAVPTDRAATAEEASAVPAEADLDAAMAAQTQPRTAAEVEHRTQKGGSQAISIPMATRRKRTAAAAATPAPEQLRSLGTLLRLMRLCST